MRTSDVVDAFLDHLRVERALSPNTVAAYGADLAKFVAYMDGRSCGELQQIETEGVSGWLASLHQAGIGPRSAARHLSALRGLMRFLLNEGELKGDPSRLAERPRSGRRLPKPLALNEVLALIEQPDPSTARGRRDRAMLSLAYAAGLRVSELLGLSLGDVDLGRGLLAAYGKGRKRRLVPLAAMALSYLESHLETAPHPAAAALVFPNPQGRPYSRQMLWKLVRRTALAAGLRHPVHPHQLRHSFATHLLAGGADLRSVQALLGHADIGTTQVYTLVTNEHLQTAHRQSHPRA